MFIFEYSSLCILSHPIFDISKACTLPTKEENLYQIAYSLEL